MAKTSDEVLDITANMLVIIKQELALYGLGETATDVIIKQITNIFEAGGTYAIALLREMEQRARTAQMN